MSASAPFAWSPGQAFECSSLLYSDGGLGLVNPDFTEECARGEMREQNELESDPAHMIRFGIVRIEVLSVEDPRPPAPPYVKDILQRVRALPRLTASLKAEIDAVLSRTET